MAVRLIMIIISLLRLRCNGNYELLFKWFQTLPLNCEYY